MSKIESENKTWGFFGTTQRNYDFSDEVTERLFNVTGQLLKLKLRLPVEQIRCFLDSRYGRHFSDELSFHGARVGMTEKEFVGVLRLYLKRSDRNNWALKQAREQELFQ